MRTGGRLVPRKKFTLISLRKMAEALLTSREYSTTASKEQELLSCTELLLNLRLCE